jgi:hypothetical protein
MKTRFWPSPSRSDCAAADAATDEHDRQRAPQIEVGQARRRRDGDLPGT